MLIKGSKYFTSAAYQSEMITADIVFLFTIVETIKTTD